jgi:hypothetical protein
MGSTYQYTPCLPCCNQCNSCPNGVSQCWSLTTTGNSNGTYNGTFCLVQSKTNACVFTDGCTNHWTLTLNGGATTLATDNGTVYTLSESLNCNGLNSFVLATSAAGSTWQPSMTINPTNCGSYPCYPNCSQQGAPCTVPCPNGIAQCWTLTGVTGVANQSPVGTCTNCAAYNMLSGSPFVWCLNKVSSTTECAFVGTCGVCGGTSAFTLTWNLSQSRWELRPDTPDALPLYVLGQSSFDCNGSNSFTISGSQGANCAGWPGVLTLSPVTCGTVQCLNCNPCASCPWPAAWTMSVSGFGGYPGDVANGDFTLVLNSGIPNLNCSGGWGATYTDGTTHNADTTVSWCLSCGGGVMTLELAVLFTIHQCCPEAIYQIPISQVACLSPITLPLVNIFPTGPGTNNPFGWWFQGWPTSITVYP